MIFEDDGFDLSTGTFLYGDHPGWLLTSGLELATSYLTLLEDNLRGDGAVPSKCGHCIMSDS